MTSEQTQKRRESKRKWYNENKKGRPLTREELDCKAKNMRKIREEWKAKAFKKLGDKCSNPACQWLNADGTRGCTDIRCLQIDHVNSDGKNESVYMTFGTATYYRRVVADTENRYQLLCANCNWIKRHVNKEFVQAKWLTQPSA